MMKRFCLFSLIIVLFIQFHKPVSATSWASIEPGEVEGRASVIVLGQYDFSSQPKHGQIFQGYSFKVKNVYKGNSNGTIIAGIDGNDIGWAEDFQQQGGEFLLFLETTKYFDFMTPVGGPNGMIQITDSVVAETEKNKVYYETFLKNNSTKVSEGSARKKNPNKTIPQSESNGEKVIISCVLISILLVIIIKLKAKKNLYR
ncbi:hypothetical protein [Bacillus sp. NEB1478]|uniref:hypothetical protein n=1 Tax=Bacillus sp. NEB1478 TaxID=3073816 RepID=UPI002873955F|nr:hypothetical protein [Bacillus sp. NEB1478]WNB91136.1 hypothetical protein RGB74_14660 [Bacillus sp. NEB1478]